MITRDVERVTRLEQENEDLRTVLRMMAVMAATALGVDNYEAEVLGRRLRALPDSDLTLALDGEAAVQRAEDALAAAGTIHEARR